MKFTTPVSMKVTQEQFEKDLKSQLESLGYNYDDYSEFILECPYLITNFGYEHDCFSWNQDTGGNYCIDHYNPELFLALAAINDGDDPIAGEWMYCIKDTTSCQPPNKTGDMILVTSFNCHKSYEEGSFNTGWSRDKFRKATKEEIINHFSFELPKEWCIKVTEENRKVLSDWKVSKGNLSPFYRTCDYLNYKGWGISENGAELYKEITFEQFKKHILKQETMKTYLVTRKQLAEIYNIARLDWKEKISKITQDTLGSFGENGYLDGRIVQEMFKAATPEQKPTLEKIFGVQDKNAFIKEFETDKLENISKDLFGDRYCLLTADRSARNIGRYDLVGRSLVVNKDYNVKLHSDEGSTLLEITKK